MLFIEKNPSTAFDLETPVAMGSTGDPPVPSGHWPDGTGKRLAPATGARKSTDAFPIPSGGSPLGTGQWPVLPGRGACSPTSAFRFNLCALFFAALLLCGTGCATRHLETSSTRRFEFATDTMAFPNDLVWEYFFDTKGRWTNQRREPRPDYTHHCFVVARVARQFFQNARFDPALPRLGESENRGLIRRVAKSNLRRDRPESEKIVIPGYRNLREFSAAQESLFKSECGGPWQSYLQRGHWRMILPMSRRHQDKMAEQLEREITSGRPCLVHIFRFPQLSINHALLLFDVSEAGREIRFATYDPNKPDHPVTLTFDRDKRSFDFPANDYFIGGRVKIYEIYHQWDY